MKINNYLQNYNFIQYAEHGRLWAHGFDSWSRVVGGESVKKTEVHILFWHINMAGFSSKFPMCYVVFFTIFFSKSEDLPTFHSKA